MKRNTIKSFRSLMSIIGPLVLVIGLAWCLHTALFVLRAERAEGVITDRLQFTSKKYATRYMAVFSYSTKAGENLAGTTLLRSRYYAHFTPGEKVKVLYDSKHPSVAYIDSFETLWGGPFILSVVGAIFTLIGLPVIRRKISSWRKHPNS